MKEDERADERRREQKRAEESTWVKEITVGTFGHDCDLVLGRDLSSDRDAAALDWLRLSPPRLLLWRNQVDRRDFG